ncbi:hypothetical protein HOLleu_26572 [Holothuria leucospilota]|uniref:Uncharacterized protein n=1 Tax=Holothuria leucospilota TaxID=206669 RepID=A0A9Q1BP23_HOLLE|nr:hypothetical protein HOLleu_26572 [Holothuria leucospilota]
MSFEMDSQDGLDEDTDDQSTQSESEASEVSPTPSLCSPTSSQLPDVDTSATAGPIKRKKVMSSLPSSGKFQN